jgi:hypothetical protein
MQCILYKIYFWNVFHMNYNLICIFICTPICTKKIILVKSGCYTNALLITSRKLSHYLQVHLIEVHTSSTLSEILNNNEATGKIAKWAIELSMYDIIYKPRTIIKAQALSDFVTKWTEMQTPPKERELEYWAINFDGSLQFKAQEQEFLYHLLKGKVSNMSCKCIFQHLIMQPSMKHCFMV